MSKKLAIAILKQKYIEKCEKNRKKKKRKKIKTKTAALGVRG